MNKYRIFLTAIPLLLLVGVLTPQFAQEPASTDKSEPEEARALLIGLMRTINTAEVTDLSKYGSYASWPILLSHQQEYFNGWLVRFHPNEPTLRFADGPEVLPGVTLRLNVHIDGRGYDVRLQDIVETKYGYASFSDESGVIYQGQPLQ